MALSAALCMLGTSQGPAPGKCSRNPGQTNDCDGLKCMWDTSAEVGQGRLRGSLVTFLEFVLQALERKKGMFEEHNDSSDRWISHSDSGKLGKVSLRQASGTAVRSLDLGQR